MNMKKQAAALALTLSLSTPAYAAGGSFPDVPPDIWYTEAVDYCLEHGLMRGADGLFRPEDTMTRAMLAQVLYSASGSPAPKGAGAFSDVPEGAWYASAAQWAFEAGVIAGGEDGCFRGDDPVTREQFAAILWRYAGAEAASGGAGFPDGDTGAAYAREAVAWAASSGIVSGFPDGRFAPRENVTRAQAAVMLQRGWSRSAVEGISLLALGEDPHAPCGIAQAEDGLILTDLYNRKVWTLQNGKLALLAGGDTAPDVNGQPVGGYHDGPADQSSFRTPWAAAPFLNGWAVSDAENNVIRYIAGGRVQTLNCSTKEPDLPISGGRVVFTYPTGLAADGDGALYVSDTHQGAIRKITPDGNVTTFASGLSDPMGLCWSGGVLYVAETGANRIVKIENGKISLVAGSGQEGLADGPASQAAFAFPQGVAVSQDGTVYVADTGNGAVRRVQNGEIVTVLSQEILGGQESMLAPVSPTGLLLAERTLYVCDGFNRAVYVVAL